MDIQEILTWTDDQVFSQTGKHLDSLQKSILEGIWQHQDYDEIATNNHRSYNHIKKESWKLWKMLSDVFQENIKQSNVKSILETKAHYNINIFSASNNIKVPKNYINICPEKQQSLERNQPPPQSSNQTPIIDLTNAPDIPYNYHNRTSELSKLKQWILEEHSKLITIYGLSEIGKTALSLQLISEIKTEFNYIIYRSLDHIPTLLNLQTDLKQTFCQNQTNPLPIIDYLRSSRCLIILDGLHHLFKNNELSGKYLTEHQDYSKFFKQIATSNHQSCLILISQEKPREITNTNQQIKTLHLQGIGENAKEILRSHQLKDEEQWTELINIYQSHPTWLNIISPTIKQFCNSKVSAFLYDKSKIYLGDIEQLLEIQIERLSPSEKQVIYWIANQKEPIDTTEKLPEIDISQSELWENIESLIRRGLVEKIPEKSLFFINPVIKEYIKSQNFNNLLGS